MVGMPTGHCSLSKAFHPFGFVPDEQEIVEVQSLNTLPLRRKPIFLINN
jgi:hypothetical protein